MQPRPRDNTPGKIESCTCASCAMACRIIPGLFTPLEALRAIRSGRADEIMSRWDDNEARSFKLRQEWISLMPLALPNPWRDPPRDIHRRGHSYDCNGRCIFLNIDDRCEIHDSGFKPVECRRSLACGGEDAEEHWREARDGWNTPVGRIVVKIWNRELAKAGR